jgi:hypothetical protein
LTQSSRLNIMQYLYLYSLCKTNGVWEIACEISPWARKLDLDMRRIQELSQADLNEINQETKKYKEMESKVQTCVSEHRRMAGSYEMTRRWLRQGPGAHMGFVDTRFSDRDTSERSDGIVPGNVLDLTDRTCRRTPGNIFRG